MSGTAAAISLSSVAEAVPILPVFDAASYAKLIDQLVKSKLIADSTAKTAYQSLNLYNEYVRNGKISVKSIWPIIQPYMDDVYNHSAASLGIPLDMRDKVREWMDTFPEWSPDQPYDIMWELANRRAKGSIASILQIAHETIPELRNENITLQKLTSQPTHSQADQLALITQLSGLQVQQSLETRALMSSTAASQSNYLGALIARDEAMRKAPASVYLNGILRGIPARLAS